MEKIIINNCKLKEEEMTDIVKKVKVLLVNSNNEILLGYSHNDYQFPGGTHEEGEDLIDTVNREIEEETGIKLGLKTLEPFACFFGYHKDWPEPGRNKKIEIYYYEVLTDELPKLENTKYTENEKECHFELRTISLNEIEKELIINIEKYGDKKGIASEMLALLKIYKEKNKKIGENMEDIKNYLGAMVTVKIDRMLGTRHPNHGFMYMVNYGYIPNTISGDGEELDAYLLGVFEPVEEYEGEVIAIIKRINDNDDKLIVVPKGTNYSDEAIRALTEFQERFFTSKIIR